MENIILSVLAAQTFQVVLDDQQCRITLYQRGRRMYLDLEVDSETVCRGAICQNRASVVPFPTLSFSGSLHFWDTLGDEPPQYDRLGTRFLLLYLAEDEDMPDALKF